MDAGAGGGREVTPVSARAHAFVPDLDVPALDDGDEHHLLRVLRLAPGDDVTAGDGAGRWRACRLAGGRALEIAGPIVAEPRPAPPITVAFALVKGERPELVVQNLTELGVDRLVPFVAGRAVGRWDPGRGGRHGQRWRTIASQPPTQCRRAAPHELAPGATLRA